MEELDVIASEEMPMFLVGIISRLEGVSYCMDGARYLIHTIQGYERVRAANANVRTFLDRVAGSKLRVVIIGRFVVGPEVGCHYFSADEARPANEIGAALAERTHAGHACCSDWTAILDEMPPGPYTLKVTGECEVQIGSSVKLRRAEPQGINPEILLLELDITPPTPTGTHVPAPLYIRVKVPYTEHTKTKYRQVTILPIDVTIDVKVVSGRGRCEG